MISVKPKGNRAELIRWRLGNMTQFAEQLRNAKWNESAQAKQDRYIRICGESCRAVSLHDKSPLCGFGKSAPKTIKTAIQLFDDATRIPGELSAEDWQKKKERRLQSWIIKQALINGRNLLQASLFCCLRDQFDELLFVLDEVSFGDKNHPSDDPKHPIVRCDLLAIGVKGANVRPVVIELKSNRDLTTLIKQLDDAAKEISSVQNAISQLMARITGKQITRFEVRKILVYPAATRGEHKKTTLTRSGNSDVIFVEYAPKDFGMPKELAFSLPPTV